MSSNFYFIRVIIILFFFTTSLLLFQWDLGVAEGKHMCFVFSQTQRYISSYIYIRNSSNQRIFKEVYVFEKILSSSSFRVTWFAACSDVPSELTSQSGNKNSLPLPIAELNSMDWKVQMKHIHVLFILRSYSLNNLIAHSITV